MASLSAGSTNARSYPVSLVFSGYYYWGDAYLAGQNYYGFFWTSLAHSSSHTVHLRMDPNMLDPQNYDIINTHGFSLRWLNYVSYPSSAAMRDSSGPALVLSGYRHSIEDQGLYGFYWSSTAYSDLSANSLYIYSLDSTPANSNYKYHGFSIRCVAQPPAPLTRVVTLCRWYFPGSIFGQVVPLIGKTSTVIGILR